MVSGNCWGAGYPGSFWRSKWSWYAAIIGGEISPEACWNRSIRGNKIVSINIDATDSILRISVRCKTEGLKEAIAPEDFI